MIAFQKYPVLYSYRFTWRVGCQKFVQYIRMLYPGRFILVESVFLRVRSFWKRRKIKFPMLQKMLANNRCLLFFIFSRIELCIKLKNSWVAKWFVRFFFYGLLCDRKWWWWWDFHLWFSTQFLHGLLLNVPQAMLRM